jgi:selenide,water dikinase
VQVLKKISPFDHSWIDHNVGSMDDAALLRPDGLDQGLVFTVDFITPLVDDPYAFGAIAAANSISDVYAMGGRPQVALSLCGFPDELVSKERLGEILKGCRDKAAEAGVAIVGGHTVIDPEMKIGLCVIGTVDPERAFRQTGAEPGDVLVLTKPIGTGIAAQGMKKDKLTADEIDTAITAMTTLNSGACEAALEAEVRAATDVTGFGLLGHLHNIVKASGCAARLELEKVPVFEFSRKLAYEGVIPSGTRRNLEFVSSYIEFAEGIDPTEQLILADAQTSGGLLLAVKPARVDALVSRLRSENSLAADVVGEITEGRTGSIEVV